MKQQLPNVIRAAFDEVYSQIEEKPKRVIKRKKPLIATVAIGLLMLTLVFSNETAFSKLQAFLGINDKGIQTAVERGEVQTIEQAVTSNGTTLTLQHAVADAFRLAFDFQLQGVQFQTKDIDSVELIYTLYDHNGQGISSLRSDTIPYEGQQLLTGIDFDVQHKNHAKNELSFTFVANTRGETLLAIEGATYVVEKIRLYRSEQEPIVIEGQWTFPVHAQPTKNIALKPLTAITDIQIERAIVSNHSTQLTATIPYSESYLEETIGLDVYIVTAEGQTIYADSVLGHGDEQAQTLRFTATFPYTTQNDTDAIELYILNYPAITLAPQ